MSKIIKREYEKSVLYFIENEMVTCKLFHTVRILNIMHFEGSILGFMLMSRAIKEDKSLFENYTMQDQIKKIFESLNSFNAFDEINSFRLNLLEKAYQDLYYAFESFIQDCFRSLFCTYPVLIRFYSKNLIAYSDLSDKNFLMNNEERINEAIDLTLEDFSKHKTLIQQIELLNQLPVNIIIPDKDIKLINEFTKNRNLLVHSDGRITRSFKKWIEENQGQETNYEVGHYLIRDYLSQSPLNSHRDLMQRTVDYLTNCISIAKNELDSFSESLNE